MSSQTVFLMSLLYKSIQQNSAYVNRWIRVECNFANIQTSPAGTNRLSNDTQNQPLFIVRAISLCLRFSAAGENAGLILG
jgi:hypothetical protein